MKKSKKSISAAANVGSEIVRLEFPAWVAEDRELLERSIAITLSQAQKE